MNAGPLLTMSPVTKTFATAPALDNVALTIDTGEIVGLIGRNGSGKSTLIKVLSGYHAPDNPGWIEIAGKRSALPIPPDSARRLGLSFMHQDLGLLPEESVLNNLRIGRYQTAFGWRIRWGREHDKAEQALAAFGLDIPLEKPVRSLSAIERGLVALVRGFLDLSENGPGVLVLDEPTAFLARDDVEQLFRAMRQLAQTGNSVLFVSHRIDEVLAITDRIVVLRDGHQIADVKTSDTNETDLVSLLLGRALHGYYPESRENPHKEEIVVTTGLSGQILQDVNLTLCAGEVVGATGIRGMGHEELPYLLFGAQQATAGTIHMGHKKIPAARMTPRKAIDNGIAFLPADRKNSSGAPDFTLKENISLPVLGSFFRTGYLHHRAERRSVTQLLREFAVQPLNSGAKMSELSGGNQQKSLIAKWFQKQPTVLIFHEPTAGVDVGAKKEVFARITEAAAQGAAVLIVSEEFEDLANLCDRVYVFTDGKISRQPLTGDALTEEGIAECCYIAAPDLTAVSEDELRTIYQSAD